MATTQVQAPPAPVAPVAQLATPPVVTQTGLPPIADKWDKHTWLVIGVVTALVLLIVYLLFFSGGSNDDLISYINAEQDKFEATQLTNGLSG